MIMSLVAVSGCATDSDEFGRCTGDFVITVTDEAVPEFAWGPSGCAVYQLLVDQASTLYWAIGTQDPVNAIHSPIRYGDSPFTDGSSGAARLTPGNTYRIQLARINADGLLEEAGERTFVYRGQDLRQHRVTR
jgi:hypothetical protein